MCPWLPAPDHHRRVFGFTRDGFCLARLQFPRLTFERDFGALRVGYDDVVVLA
jgi:hypothetical protein